MIQVTPVLCCSISFLPTSPSLLPLAQVLTFVPWDEKTGSKPESSRGRRKKQRRRRKKVTGGKAGLSLSSPSTSDPPSDLGARAVLVSWLLVPVLALLRPGGEEEASDLLHAPDGEELQPGGDRRLPPHLDLGSVQVPASFCKAAGLRKPGRVEECGLEQCPDWRRSPWAPCQRAECLSRDTGGGGTGRARANITCQVCGLAPSTASRRGGWCRTSCVRRRSVRGTHSPV